MNTATVLLSVCVCLPFLGSTSPGQFTNTSSVLDGSGAMSSGGALTNISAAGQPGGIYESGGGGFVNQAGFLNTFFLKPGLDTDSDGLADEIDRDNDNDGLTDVSEINGNEFSPATPTLVNVADTDEDGIIDGFEASSGTDPDNPDALLKLVAISNAAGARGVAWLARGNNEKTYVVRAANDPKNVYGTVVFSNTVAGGSAPWFELTNSVLHASASTSLFYAVEVYP